MKRFGRRSHVLVVATALVALVVPVARAQARSGAAGWTARPATYGVAVEENVVITMSDGAELDAEIHRPAAADGTPASGRFPVLLVQTPYNHRIQDPSDDYLVTRGYVDVIVDVRGTGGSAGAYDATFTSRSQRDSKELVDWAASQPWSNGRVGLHGESYYGINQLLTAAQPDISPALKAIFPVVPTGDNYRSNFPGGYLTSLFPFAIQNAANGLVPPGYTTANPMRAARSMAEKAAGTFLQMGNSAWLLAGDDRSYDGPGYCNISPLCLIDHIRTPTFLAGGWFDALSQRDAPMLFHELQRRGVPVKLLMGPWYHTTPGRGLPADGIRPLQELRLRWFDRHVRGDDDPGLDSWGPVVYQRLGEGRFHTAPTWPVPGIRHTRAHLRDGGALGARPGTGSDVLVSQPASGACTRSTYIGTFGLVPSTPCETDDGLNDRTGATYDLPVTRDLDLTGPISAHLFVSTTRTDAFVTLRLEDVDPVTGRAEELTSGWDSLVFRELDDSRSTKVGADYVVPYHPYTRESVERQRIQPGRVYDWWVEIRPIAARIPAGHRLRFSVQTSDALRFLPTAGRLAGSAASVVTIHHDSARPSMVLLPVTAGSVR